MAEHRRSISIFKAVGVKENISVSRERVALHLADQTRREFVVVASGYEERGDGVQNMWLTRVAKVHTDKEFGR